ncbi:MAG: hypothetical protein ACYDDF_11895 [Thermoplasmatota archaeon]
MGLLPWRRSDRKAASASQAEAAEAPEPVSTTPIGHIQGVAQNPLMAMTGNESLPPPQPRMTAAAQQLAPSQHLVRVHVRAAPHHLAVPGADVLVFPTQPEHLTAHDHPPYPSATGLTGPDGIVRFVLQSGLVTFLVRHAGGEVTQRVTIDGPMDVLIETRGGTVAQTLTVQVRRGDEPAVGEAVRLPDGRIFVTNDQGRAVVPLPPGRYILECSRQRIEVNHKGRDHVIIALPTVVPADHEWAAVESDLETEAEFGMAGDRRTPPQASSAPAARLTAPRSPKAEFSSSRRGPIVRPATGLASENVPRGSTPARLRSPESWQRDAQTNTAMFRASILLGDDGSGTA